MTDKRTQVRFGPLVLKAELQIDGGQREGYLTNIGSGGAFLAIENPPKIGTDVTLRALLPWSLGELRAQTRVVWCNDPDSSKTAGSPITGAGLAFTKLDADSQRALELYLQRFAKLAAELDGSAEIHDGH
jgi:Tfp pilus assembly protein PilZ